MSPLLLTGIVRLCEALVILYYIFKKFMNFQVVGCDINQIVPGLYYGGIGSLAFGIIAFFIIFGVKYLYQVNLIRMIQMPIPETMSERWLHFAVGCIIGPFTEELVFRGIVYGYFRKWGVTAACLLSTFIFVVLHSHVSMIPVTQIVGGLVFALSYEYTKMLATPLTIHILGNSCMLLLSYLPIII